jgi:phenylalanine-4-hydroxylase
MSPFTYTLDTSFVIRLLTRDPIPLFQRAAAFLEQWESGAPGFFVPDLVLAETYFALQHHYRFPKADALSTLLSFTCHPAITVSPYLCHREIGRVDLVSFPHVADVTAKLLKVWLSMISYSETSRFILKTNADPHGIREFGTQWTDVPRSGSRVSEFRFRSAR